MAEPTVVIEAGRHDRAWCPIHIPVPDPRDAELYRLIHEAGEDLFAEPAPDGGLHAVVPFLAAGETRRYRITPYGLVSVPRVVTVEDRDGALDISVDGELLTRYVFTDAPARPYFYPVNAPGHIPVTRAFPMVPDAPGETRDHPHHRSLWIAHGEVNGADNWSEGPGHGYTQHQAFSRVDSGYVAGGFESVSLWTTADGGPLLTQRLTLAAWNTGSDIRLIDFGIRLEATHGDVHFGDTKEGGILSVRVASELDVPRSGRITNVFGGIDEAETWGKSSHWCDYSGSVEGRPAGIAVMDHPNSFRYPTHWHVRNYGLMTANPFGYAAYTGGIKDGSYTLPAGKLLEFHYRVALHRGSRDEADIRARYLDFVAPPRVTVEA